MSITDELRKWGYGFCGDTHDVVTAIADRIDAAHEEAIQQVLMGEGSVPATDENMAEHGWYRALDADKQPIKFDDKVEHNGVVAKVHGITFHGTTPPTVCIVRGDCWVEADELRHRHTPTVEDVLRKFLGECEHASMLGYTDMPQDIFDTYATKLRLAGDAE